MGAWGRLRVLDGAHEGTVFVLERPVHAIGRSEGNDIRLGDPTVSRRQAEVRSSSGGVMLVGLTDKNPAWVNGEILGHSRRLIPGDKIQFGVVHLVFEDASSPAPPPRRPTGAIVAGGPVLRITSAMSADGEAIPSASAPPAARPPVASPRCPMCGAAEVAGSRYCGTCGSRIGTTGAFPAVPSPPGPVAAHPGPAPAAPAPQAPAPPAAGARVGTGTASGALPLPEQTPANLRVRTATMSRPPEPLAPGALGEFMAAGPGDVLRGRFEIRRILGGGRSSDVFAAFDRERKCEVALRVLRPELARNPDARDRFFHAANSFVVVEHAGLVPVYGVFEEGERCFAALELLAGVSLADEMRARPVSAGGYPVEDAFRVGGVLCAALQRLHTVIAHGDVRPENVWIGRHGETRLLDPGLVAPPGARLAWPPGDLEAAVWTSPEVLKGHPPDALSDQWSLAAILYRMLGGEPPVGRAPPLRALRREVPDAAARAIDRALSVRPGDRFLTMSALAEGMGDGDSTAGRLLRRLLGRGRAPKPEAPG